MAKYIVEYEEIVTEVNLVTVEINTTDRLCALECAAAYMSGKSVDNLSSVEREQFDLSKEHELIGAFPSEETGDE